MRKLIVIGSLGKDAENVSWGGNPYTTFHVAENETYKDKQTGEKKQNTTWIYCSKYGENENLLPYLKKGTKIYVEGVPAARSYTDKDGNVKPILDLRVTNVELLGGGGGNQERASQQRRPPVENDAPAKKDDGDPFGGENNDDLPF